MPAKNRNFLLIDDNDEDREAIHAWISRNNDFKCKITEATSLAEGLLKLKNLDYDCVFLDHSFPEGSALDFLQSLPATSSTSVYPPIIIVTGQGNERVAVQAMKAGAFDYIRKDDLRINARASVTREALAHFDRTRSIARLEIERDDALARLKAREETLATTVIKLKEAKESADDANVAKSAFLASMSHEIRSPLTAIIGFALLLKNDGVPENDRSYLIDSIHRNGEHLLGVINDILDFSKVEAGKISLKQEEVCIEQMILDVADIFRRDAERKDLKLRLFFHPDTPISFSTDALRLRQVLTNLLSNAIKFTDSGEISIVTQPLFYSSISTQISITVSDTGIGIARAELAKLFSSFSQANSTIEGRFGGSGLGLMLSRKLTRLLGGDLELVSSEPNRGSQFRITLPVLGFDGSIQAHQMPLMSENALRIDGVKILVVDDSPDNLYLIKTILNNAGATVECVDGGQAALDIVDSKKFDAIILDVQMPGIDGHEAARRMRQRDIKTPIIGLTANVMPEDLFKSKAAGFNDQLTKPINVPDLIKTISSFTTSAQRLKIRQLDK